MIGWTYSSSVCGRIRLLSVGKPFAVQLHPRAPPNMHAYMRKLLLPWSKVVSGVVSRGHSCPKRQTTLRSIGVVAETTRGSARSTDILWRYARARGRSVRPPHKTMGRGWRRKYGICHIYIFIYICKTRRIGQVYPCADWRRGRFRGNRTRRVNEESTDAVTHTCLADRTRNLTARNAAVNHRLGPEDTEYNNNIYVYNDTTRCTDTYTIERTTRTTIYTRTHANSNK